MKIQKKNWGGGGVRFMVKLGGGEGQVGCERRIEVFVKIKKKKHFFLGGRDQVGWGGLGWVGGGGSGWMCMF